MKTLRVEELTGVVGRTLDYPKDFSVDLSTSSSDLRKLWGVVLLLAVDDKATSVHYHPGRPDGALAYIVNNTRYEMVPPPQYLAMPLIAAARSFIEPTWGLIGRFAASHQSAISGSFVLDVSGEKVEWDVVCWSVGSRIGAEFYRAFPPADLTTLDIN